MVHSYTNSDQGDLKIDWVASQKDHVYGRYSQQHIVNPTTNSQQLIGNGDNEFPLYNGVLDYAHTFSSTFLNDARIGASYFPVTEGYSNPTGQNLAATFGIAGAAPGQTFLPGQIFTGSSFVTNGTSAAFGNNDLISLFHDTVIQAEDTERDSRQAHHQSWIRVLQLPHEHHYVGNAGLAGQFTITAHSHRIHQPPVRPLDLPRPTSSRSSTERRPGHGRRPRHAQQLLLRVCAG